MDNTIDQQSQPHGHTGHGYSGVGSGGINAGSNNIHQYNSRGYGGLNHWASRNDYRDVVLPAIPQSHLYTQGMSYLIRSLEADTQYEAKVQAR